MIVLEDKIQPLTQPNNGDAQGSLFATYNIDLAINKGRVRVGGNTIAVLTNEDDEDFDGYAAQIIQYDDKYFAISDKVFSASSIDGTWTEETTGDEPDSGNTIMDAEVFDGLLLVSTATDIKSYNGTTWSSWWQTTLSQSALTSGQRHLLRVGADGNLYITNGGNKEFRVTPASSVTTTGAGTLDFSSTPYEFTCKETTSSRLFIGTKYIGGEAVILEWDMGSATTSANRIHKTGAEAVWCIAIWNDTPIAVLSNGRFKYHDGNSFVDWPNAQLPIGGKILDAEFIHSNGWAIIDGLPHFLVRGSDITGANTFAQAIQASWNFPSGVWCLDPAVGLTHRFSVGAGTDTQFDYGQPTLSAVGALTAVNSSTSKFLASFEYFSNATTAISALVYEDTLNAKPCKGFLATIPFDTFSKPWTQIKSIHKRLGDGDFMTFFYRTHEEPSTLLTGVWASTTQFNTTEDTTDVVEGYTMYIKSGNGAGQLVSINRIVRSSSVTELHFNTEVLLVVAEEESTVEVLNFRFLSTVTGKQDWKELSIPSNETARRMQVLLEIHQAAGNSQEVDYVIMRK